MVTHKGIDYRCQIQQNYETNDNNHVHDTGCAQMDVLQLTDKLSGVFEAISQLLAYHHIIILYIDRSE